jgi:hypothetical protein
MNVPNKIKLQKRLFGRRVLLVGSAPNPLIPDLDSFDVIVSSNASSGGFRSAGLVPEVTFVGSAILSDRIEKRDWEIPAEHIRLKPPPSYL